VDIDADFRLGHGLGLAFLATIAKNRKIGVEEVPRPQIGVLHLIRLDTGVLYFYIFS